MNKILAIAVMVMIVMASAAPAFAVRGNDSPADPAVSPATAGDDFDFDFDEYSDGADISDPLEGMNRVFFGFNEALYKGVFRPVSKGYSAVVPEKARGGVSNFFTNLMAPVRLLNCLLQGRMKDAGMEVSKFIANTAFGLGGLMDVTKGRKRMYEVNEKGADFGQTLAVWGWDTDTYLVLPVLGSSTPRDGIGVAADLWADPTFHVDVLWQSVAIKATKETNDIAQGKGDVYDGVFQEMDPYVAARTMWWQNRQAQVRGEVVSNGSPGE